MGVANTHVATISIRFVFQKRGGTLKGMFRLLAPLLLAVVALLPWALQSEASSSTPAKTCADICHSEAGHNPPEGFVVVIDSYVTSNCTLVLKRSVLPRAQFLASLQQVSLISTPVVLPNQAATAAGPAGDPTITTHQRLWDLGGINPLTNSIRP